MNAEFLRSTGAGLGANGILLVHGTAKLQS